MRQKQTCLSIHDDMIHRNLGIISELEQAQLGTAKILIAGCGSVGGSIVEHLVRSGLRHLVLADPEAFDLSNLNRQVCTFADIGRNKADIVAARAKAVNPFVEVTCFSEGITETNLDDAFDGVNIVFDGIDAGCSSWEKYLIHKIAAKRSIPVLAGFDFGGKAVVYTFDYRRNQTPFYGRATEASHRKGDVVQALKWLGYQQYPADYLPIIADRLISKDPWPQVSYCVLAMGALGVRTIIDVLMARKVPHKVCFDVHMASRRQRDAWLAYLAWPLNLIRTIQVSRNQQLLASANTKPHQLSAVQNYLEDHQTIKQIIAVMIRAPSPHNCQPWLFDILDQHTINIRWNKKRLLKAIDPRGFTIMYSLGCVIEAASSVANITFTPSNHPDFFADDYAVGTLKIGTVDHQQFLKGRNLNLKRASNRFAFLPVDIQPSLLHQCIQATADTAASCTMLNACQDFIHALAKGESRRLFQDNDYVHELMSYMNMGTDAKIGFTSDALSISRVEGTLLAWLKRNPPWLQVAQRCGLRRMMATSAVATVKHSASFMLISTKDWSDAGRLEVGRVMMKIWLLLTEADLACQPVDFPISSAASRRAMRQKFNLSHQDRLVLLLRVGRATRHHQQMSAREEITQFVQLNEPCI